MGTAGCSLYSRQQALTLLEEKRVHRLPRAEAPDWELAQEEQSPW